jgi:hypothetical protein
MCSTKCKEFLGQLKNCWPLKNKYFYGVTWFVCLFLSFFVCWLIIWLQKLKIETLILFVYFFVCLSVISLVRTRCKFVWLIRQLTIRSGTCWKTSRKWLIVKYSCYSSIGQTWYVNDSSMLCGWHKLLDVRI